MEYQDVRAEVVKALKWYGFYLFDKGKQEAIREILRLLGDLRPLVKVRNHPQKVDYFILEVDAQSFESICRDRCSRNGLIDPSCYNRCFAESSRNIIDKIATALRG